MIAALFSRNVSQVLIALIGATTTIGGPLLAYFLHKRVGAIQVTVNGRLEELVQRVESIETKKE